METITIEINKSTSSGKTLIKLLEYFSENTNGVKIKKEIKKTPKARVLKTFQEIDEGKNLIDTKNHKDLLDKLYS